MSKNFENCPAERDFDAVFKLLSQRHTKSPSSDKYVKLHVKCPSIKLLLYLFNFYFLFCCIAKLSKRPSYLRSTYH